MRMRMNLISSLFLHVNSSIYTSHKAAVNQFAMSNNLLELIIYKKQKTNKQKTTKDISGKTKTNTTEVCNLTKDLRSILSVNKTIAGAAATVAFIKLQGFPPQRSLNEVYKPRGVISVVDSISDVMRCAQTIGCVSFGDDSVSFLFAHGTQAAQIMI